VKSHKRFVKCRVHKFYDDHTDGSTHGQPQDRMLSAANRHQNTEQLLQSHPLHEIKTRNFILSRVILCVFLTPTSLNKQLDRPTFSTSIVRPVNSYTHDMTMLNTACRLAHKRKTGDYRSSIISVTTMAVIT